MKDEAIKIIEGFLKLDDWHDEAVAPKKLIEQAQRCVKKRYCFAEALTDIAFIAGAKGYHSGDSREDIGTMIKWAMEFEATHKDTEWNGSDGKDYMIAIEEFAEKRIAESGNDTERSPIRVILIIEGGNLQEIISTHNIKVHLVDWDNIEAGDELVSDIHESPDEIVTDAELTALLEELVKEAKEKQS